MAEHEIQHLSKNITLEKLRNIELERQLEDLKSCCTCSQQKIFETTLAESETNFNHKVELDRLHPTNFDEVYRNIFCIAFSYGSAHLHF